MDIVKEEKYLGDIISFDGKMDKNIANKIKKGNSSISTIMIILRDSVFGSLYFETALFMRESVLLSSMLLNGEAWVGLSKTNLEDLEKVDESFLQRILEVPGSTPIPALYLELGCIPIRFILMKKRIIQNQV